MHLIVMLSAKANQSFRFSSSRIAWWAAFFSPTLYFLSLVLADRIHLRAPPESIVATLFFLIPIAALLFCGTTVWSSNRTSAHKMARLLFTILGIALQFFAILVLLSAMLAAITAV